MVAFFLLESGICFLLFFSSLLLLFASSPKFPHLRSPFLTSVPPRHRRPDRTPTVHCSSLSQKSFKNPSASFSHLSAILQPSSLFHIFFQAPKLAAKHPSPLLQPQQNLSSLPFTAKAILFLPHLGISSSGSPSFLAATPRSSATLHGHFVSSPPTATSSSAPSHCRRPSLPLLQPSLAASSSRRSTTLFSTASLTQIDHHARLSDPTATSLRPLSRQIYNSTGYRDLPRHLSSAGVLPPLWLRSSAGLLLLALLCCSTTGFPLPDPAHHQPSPVRSAPQQHRPH